MKHEIKTQNPMHIDAEAAWAVIRTGGGVDKWLPMIKTCRVEGNMRFCTTEDGFLEEEIVESNDTLRRFRYGIPKQNILPVSGIKGELRVEPTSDSESVLHWDVEFDLEDESLLAGLEEGFRGIYAAGAAGITEVARKNRRS